MDIEATHLTDLKRIEKLFSVVMLAFAWAYVVGVFTNENIKPIRLSSTEEKQKVYLNTGWNISQKHC